MLKVLVSTRAFGRLSSLRCCSSRCVTHDPKRKRIAFDVLCRVTCFQAGEVAGTWRAIPNDHDVGRLLLQLPAPAPTTTTTTTTTLSWSSSGSDSAFVGCGIIRCSEVIRVD